MKSKLLSLSMLMLFVSTVLFTGCGKDEDTAPTDVAATVATVTGATGSTSTETGNYATGTPVTITYSATTGNELTKVVVSKTVGTTTSVLKTETSFTDKKSFSGSYAYTITESYGKVIIKIEATDNKGTTTFDTFELNVGTQFSGEKTGQLLNNITGPLKGAYDLQLKVNLSSTDAEAGKDMKNTTVITSSGPNNFDKGWTTGTGNTTMYVKANSFNYTSGTKEEAAAAFLAGTKSGTVTAVAVGDIYIAQLRGSTTTGVVIKVTKVVDDSSASTNDGYIEFSFKY